MYPKSKDYARLWELVQSGQEIVVLLKNKFGTPESDLLFKNRLNFVHFLGAYTLGRDERDFFINTCKRVNLEFIEPGPVVSEGALEVLDMAIERADRLSVSPAVIDPRRVGQLEKLLKENEAIRDGLKEIRAALTLKKEQESEAES